MMKLRAKNKEEILSEALNVHGQLSPEDADAARARTLKYLESNSSDMDKAQMGDTASVRQTRPRRWLAVAAVAAAITLAVVLPSRIVQSAPAVLEDASGSRKIHYGEVLRPSGDMSAMLAMTGGARIEVRSMSELSLERVDDGIRIRLNNGGVIVDAVAQRDENLYVQTKDVMASVAGAVSLVQAEEQGSRVTAIGGEVRVQQGTAETKLRSGEQVISNPQMESLSVKAELNWSREALAHVAMLQQEAIPPTSAGQKGSRLAFDVASIRSSGAPVPSAPRARGGESSGAIRGCVPGSSGYSQQLDPRRLLITKTTLFQLIGYAYPVPGVPETIWKQYPGPDSCLLLSKIGLLPGGPDWIRADMWDVETAIPQGAFTSKPSLTDPKLQQMLQSLLEERFKVVIRRETREMPVYLLKVGKDGAKFNGPRSVATAVPLQPGQKPRVIVGTGPDGNRTRTVQSADGTFSGASAGNAMPGLQVASASRSQDGTIALAPPSRDGISKLDATGISIGNWVNHLFASLGRPVLDRSGLVGRFDFHFDFQGPSSADVVANPSQFDSLPESVNRDAVKAMGFELEESRAPVEVWVIVSAAKPSEN